MWNLRRSNIFEYFKRSRRAIVDRRSDYLFNPYKLIEQQLQKN